MNWHSVMEIGVISSSVRPSTQASLRSPNDAEKKSTYSMNEQTIFTEALALPDARERADYVRRACGSDQDLRRRIESLLQEHERSGGFLDVPALEPRGLIGGTNRKPQRRRGRCWGFLNAIERRRD